MQNVDMCNTLLYIYNIVYILYVYTCIYIYIDIRDCWDDFEPTWWKGAIMECEFAGVVYDVDVVEAVCWPVRASTTATGISKRPKRIHRGGVVVTGVAGHLGQA